MKTFAYQMLSENWLYKIRIKSPNTQTNFFVNWTKKKWPGTLLKDNGAIENVHKVSSRNVQDLIISSQFLNCHDIQ